MKILRITLENIASLSGLQTVDFTQDPLRSAGLFSISGNTGAGKSTLLDALCLALYDRTPRLDQTGRLAELSTGERQNDPRMLLRRGAGAGLAEVAFVGVDGQVWTSRWSVRRSHRKSDGSLQNVEMTLYRGHIAPRGEGPVEAGGKKTAVLTAIAEKIGLTFQQFTRAVLLAQNDFATFLKADDKERAEILQALTGTERFESISRAAFARAAAEKKTVEVLQARREGNPPLSAEERAAAETARDNAVLQLNTIETQLTERRAQAEWYQIHTALRDEHSRATEALTQAIAAQDAAASRQRELELTETVCREAGPLRTAESEARITFTQAVQQAELSRALISDRQAAFDAADVRFREATVSCNAALEEQQSSQPMLQTARELDARLEPLQKRVQKAESAAHAAKQALDNAEQKLSSAIHERNKIGNERQNLEQELNAFQDFRPLAADAAKWLDRIDRVIESTRELSEAQASLEQLTQQLTVSQQKLEVECQLAAERTLIAQSSLRSLQDAEHAEAAFDADQLAVSRSELEARQRRMTRLCEQVREIRNRRETADAISREIDQLSNTQQKQETELRQIVDVQLPRADQDVATARTMLEKIRTALDDQAHAGRLRRTLRPDEPCLVCGSTSHPWRDHETTSDDAAVSAAMQAVNEFKSRRDEIQSQRTQLDAAVQAGSVIFQKRSQEYQEETRRIEVIRIDAAEHPEVVAILTLPEAQQLTAVDETLLQISQSLDEIIAAEMQYRAAQKHSAQCRKEEKQSSAAAAAAQLRLSDVEKSHAVLQERRKSADSTLTRCSAEHKIRQTQLDELWQHLPGMVSLFHRDPDEFRRTFESATGTCIRLEKRMAELHTRFQELSATIAPLEESVRTARSAFDQCDTELVTLTNEQQLLLQDRSQLFDGRPVAIVEQEFADLVCAASDAVEHAAAQRIDADKNLELAKADTEAKLRTRTDAEAALHAAEQTLHRWISDFCTRTSTPITLSDLDQRLTRDEQWIRSERALQQQLAHAVTAAQTACEVHATKLEQHLARQHGTEEESAVMAALAELQVARQQAQDLADSARAVIQNDDDLQRKNTELASEIALQQQKADPWLKLNELIGSQDGAKFRMIAQRRTLDLLLRYANHQLNHLAARYRLERISESLNLIVVDRDMSDEQRSIHSLSGGESFLVSLALALALASLTSNRLRIESLFIDEGFGSLDKETLNTAMSALMHLEAQGRKVGVISHVTEMTDAIPVQIQIVKGRGGTSRIVIPGAAASDSVSSVRVSAVSDSTPETTASPQSIAAEMLAILQRERDRGKTRVSCRALREELNCTAETFKAAQSLLQDSVEPDGRSLRLKS